MEFFDLVKRRRSIRKYQDRQIERGDLEKIIQAGLCAPNAGGGQRAIIVAVRNRALCEKIGRLNIAKFNRNSLAGSYVSSEQPSIIDDPSIRSGFYGAPTVCAVFGPKNFLYSVADAFCCAENMALAATELGLASCLIARGEETFDNEPGAALLKEWRIPDGYVARCFVLLGYHAGAYPQDKPRRADRQPGRRMRWAYGCTDLFEKAAVCRGAEFFHRRPGRNTAGALYQRHPLYFGRALFFHCARKRILP